MATIDKVNFRQSSNQEIVKRPLSTYDNLNTTTITSEPKSNMCDTNGGTVDKLTMNVNGNGHAKVDENVNEFPFDDISFRFDELKQPKQPQNVQSSSSNGYDNINNTSDIDNNYKFHRSSNNSTNNHSSEHSNINGSHQMRNNQGYAKTTTAQNHSHVPSSTSSSMSSTSGGSSSNNSSISSSPNGDGYTNLANGHQYENVAGDTITHNSNSINGKPVHSDAKSLFFGLHKNAGNTTNSSNIHNKLVRNNSNLDKSPKSNYDENGNTDTQQLEEEPLLHAYNDDSNSIVIAGPSRINAQTIAQYQNVPGNSAFFNQKQNIDANVCTCKCIDSNAEIKQCETNQYKCNGCLRTNGIQTTSTSNTSNSMVNGTIYATSGGGDLASCSASMKSAKPITLDTSTSYRMSQSLSQAVYMSTTVPQNIKGSNIMGSHLPTRNSLRHSRMIVGNKSYQVVRRRNPLNIQHPSFVKYLFLLHVLVGLTVSCLGLWLCWWAPSTRARENPYWSGLILMLSGILGLVVIAYKRIPRHKLRQHLFTFLRINSTCVTFIATLCAFLASTFAILHLINLFSPMAVCRPVNMLVDSSACTCRFDNATIVNDVNGVDRKLDGEIAGGSYYRDLSCNEVMGPFKYILVASAISNFTGFLLCFTVLILLCIRQNLVKRVPYCSATSRNRL